MITYSATLDVPAETARLLTELVVADRLRRGTGVGSRAASVRDRCADPTKGRGLHSDNTTRNQRIGSLRDQGERGIALLKTRWKALNRIRLCPQRIGAIAKAALVLTNVERPIR